MYPSSLRPRAGVGDAEDGGEGEGLAMGQVLARPERGLGREGASAGAGGWGAQSAAWEGEGLALGQVLACPERGLDPVGDADALEDAGEVGLDRPLGDFQPAGDLLVRHALPDQA